MPSAMTVPVQFMDSTFRHIPTTLLHAVRGLDADRDIVVNVSDLPGPDDQPEYLIALTECCTASGKGGEGGIVCRSCYRPVDPKHGTYVLADDVAVPVHRGSVLVAKLLHELGVDPFNHPGPYTEPNIIGVALLSGLVAALDPDVEGPAHLRAAQAIVEGRQPEWLAAVGYTEQQVRKSLREALGVTA